MSEKEQLKNVPLQAASPFELRVNLGRGVPESDVRTALATGEMGFLHSVTTGSTVAGPGERMEEVHLPGGECSRNVGFRDATAQVHAQFERASCLQRNILQLLFLTHRRLVSVKSAVDHIHLLLASQPHEVHGIS